MSKKDHASPGLMRRCDGAAAVEFAIVLNVLLVLIMGMIDFGHAWFMKQVITNASREGARAGVIYPHPLNQVEQTVTAAVRSHLPGNMVRDPNLSIPAPVIGTGNAGDPLTVTVNYTKHWWVVNYFVPSLGDSVQMSGQTIMRYE